MLKARSARFAKALAVTEERIAETPHLPRTAPEAIPPRAPPRARSRANGMPSRSDPPTILHPMWERWSRPVLRAIRALPQRTGPLLQRLRDELPSDTLALNCLAWLDQAGLIVCGEDLRWRPTTR